MSTFNQAQLWQAVSFAARAHRHQLRKDGQTPYAAHTFRVCLVLQLVFGIHDSETLAIALLHDTIEDTPTDYDDIEEQFGTTVAQGVSLLTKDMRMQHTPREADYIRALAGAPWRVQVCKLADIYDNLSDVTNLTPEKQGDSYTKHNRVLAELKPHLKPEALPAFTLVEKHLHECQSRG